MDIVGQSDPTRAGFNMGIFSPACSGGSPLVKLRPIVDGYFEIRFRGSNLGRMDRRIAIIDELRSIGEIFYTDEESSRVLVVVNLGHVDLCVVVDILVIGFSIRFLDKQRSTAERDVEAAGETGNVDIANVDRICFRTTDGNVIIR